MPIKGRFFADDTQIEKCYSDSVPKWADHIGRIFLMPQPKQWKLSGAVFLLPKMEGGIGMSKKQKKDRWWVTMYWSMVGMVSTVMLSLHPVLAASTTIWDRFSLIMKDIYGQLVGISTIVAVTVASIALIVRMVSRNQRSVDEATAWLKRIVATWIILNSLGFIVAYLQPLIAGGNYNP